MGTVSEKLVYLNDTKTKLRNGINRIGGTIDTDDTFRSYVDELNDIYQDMPKVTDTGTSITLDNTRHGGLEIGLSGNTYQETTTGKNLLDLTTSQTTIGGIPISVENGIIKLNGTTSSSIANWYCRVFQTNSGSAVFSLEVTGYTDKDGNNASLLVQQNTENASTGWTTLGEINLKSNQPKEVSVTLDNTKYYRVRLFTSDNTFTNATIKAQLEYGTTKTDWEKYTNGASPNPDYPQDIHVVSGDNTINVVGKNLINYTMINPNASLQDNGYYRVSFPNGTTILENFKANTQYTISFNGYGDNSGNNGRFVINYTDGTSSSVTVAGTTATDYSFATASGKTIDTIKTSWGSSQITYLKDLMLEEGSSKTSYVPYVSSSYQVNLPVENLFDGTQVTTTNPSNWGVSFENNVLSIEHKNSYSSGAPNIVLGTLPSGNYTLSYKSVNKMSLYINGTYDQLIDDGETFVVEDGKTYAFYFSVADNSTVTFTNILLEKGNKVNSYTPYGTTPIKLYEIGTYKDRFIRNSGKNLASGLRLGFYAEATGEYTYNANYGCSISPINVISGSTYRFSINGTYSTAYIYPYDKNGNYLGRTGTNSYGVYQPSSDVAYFNYLFGNGTISSVPLDSKIQIELGAAITPYEPYGNGDWYLHKEIGKVVFDGTENWGGSTFGDYYRTQVSVDDIITNLSANDTSLYSNYFYADNGALGANNAKPGMVCHYRQNNNVYFVINEGDYNAFKTWLGTHNTELYYRLATPTNTEITYQPLIEQLNNLEKAMSYNGQTNISQVNNDLPFIISASALKDWQESNTLNSTLSMSSPLLGNINTIDLQPIESDIQPLEINEEIEPLEEGEYE